MGRPGAARGEAVGGVEGGAKDHLDEVVDGEGLKAAPGLACAGGGTRRGGAARGGPASIEEALDPGEGMDVWGGTPQSRNGYSNLDQCGLPSNFSRGMMVRR